MTLLRVCSLLLTEDQRRSLDLQQQIGMSILSSLKPVKLLLVSWDP